MKKWVGVMLVLGLIWVLIGLVIIPVIAQGGEFDVQIPGTINYQGYLTDDSGTPIDGVGLEMRFTIYEDEFGTMDVWRETQYVDVTDGLFAVMLGSGSPMDSSIFADTGGGGRYLGIKVGADPEMTPIQELTTVAYAYHADYANNANKLDGKDSSEFADGYSLDAADGSPVDAVYVDNSGNVGIGTINPQASLHMDSYGNTELRVEHDDVENMISFYDSGALRTGHLIKDDDSMNLRISADGSTDHVVIKETGEVGIGGTNPSAELDVKGDIHASGTITSGNSIDINGTTHVISSDSDLILDPFSETAVDQSLETQTGVWNSTDKWQSFTAGMDGILTQIDVKNFTNELTATLTIYEGEGTGGTLLSTTTGITLTASTWVEIPLAETVDITSSSVYTWRIQTSTNNNLIENTSNAYAGGRNDRSASYDYLFRTHVSVEGNVGIGEMNPSTKLDVDGTVNATAFTGDGSGLDGLYTQSEVDALIASLEACILAVAKSWGTAEMIETVDWASALKPQVAVDGSGNAVVVWQQWDPLTYSHYDSWSNRYVAGTGWGTAELIETNNAGGAEFPQVAVDSSGNAVAVWRQSDGIRVSIWSNRYVAGTGWGTEELIETGTGYAERQQIAVDSSGNAVAVWQQEGTGFRFDIWSNRYVAGTGWGTAELIETDNAGDALYPQVALDSSGNAVAVWGQSDGSHSSIWSNRYVAGTGWGTAETIETGTQSANSPQIAVDSSGNAVSVWEQWDGTRYDIWSNRYVAGTGWGTEELIETDNAGNARYPQVAVDSSGNAVAVWEQNDGSRINIWSNRYVAGTGWGTAELIETNNAGGAHYPQVAVGPSGNAVAVWEQSDGSRDNIWSNRYITGMGWGTEKLIEVDNAGDAGDPQVSVDSSGNAVAVWQQWDGTVDNIWSNRYEF